MADETVMLARVTGRVQGVWFRAWAKGEAEGLHLRGWVRNEPDGSVSALMIGRARAVNDMVRALRHGPPGARVTAVETVTGTDDGSQGFRIAG